MKTTEQIENYLSGNLSEDEKIAFETELGQNKDLAEEVNLHKRIHSFLFEKEVGNLKSEVKNWLAENQTKEDQQSFRVIKNSSSQKTFYITGIAAALVLFIGIFWWISTKNSFSVNQYYAEISNESPTQLQGNDNHRSEWVSKFQEKKFDEVIQLLNLPSLSAEEIYFLGVAEMLKSPPDYTSAVKYFSSTKVQDSIWQEKAAWLKCLALYKNNQKNAAKSILMAISRTDSEFKQKAQNWLNNW